MAVSSSFEASGFDRFGLHASLLRGIRDLGFDTPRPIQRETIPAGLDGRDVLGLAQTGTGKTAAFALPTLHRLLEGGAKGPRVLVLAPTRELATQIAAEITALSKHTRLKTVTVFGGVSMRNQVVALRKRPEIVVGCPGRVLDLVEQKVLRLGQVETLVLDEADHMFDMGFLPTIRKILAALPRRRQNLLFSATMPSEVRGLADDLLNNPHVVELADAAPAETIDHALYMVAERRKRGLLEHVLTSDECNSAIVFIRTKHRARRLAEQLSEAGHRAIGLQGNLSQAQRDRAMRGFRSRRYDVLVATDIAARGIDVEGVSHVINFDVPNTPEAYTHRIGRTGRSERDGIACTFVTRGDTGWVRATERMIGAPIPRRRVAGFSPDPDEQVDSGRSSRSGGTRSARPGERRSGRPGDRQSGRSDGRRGGPGQYRKGRTGAPRRGNTEEQPRWRSDGRGGHIEDQRRGSSDDNRRGRPGVQRHKRPDQPRRGRTGADDSRRGRPDERHQGRHVEHHGGSHAGRTDERHGQSDGRPVARQFGRSAGQQRRNGAGPGPGRRNG